MTDVILPLLNAVISFVIGGGVSRLLDAFTPWKDWHPTFQGKDAPFIKSIAAFLLTAFASLALAFLYQELPNVFPKLPTDLQNVIVLFFSIVGAFIKHGTVTAANLKAQVRQLNLDVRNEHARWESADPIGRRIVSTGAGVYSNLGKEP